MPERDRIARALRAQIRALSTLTDQDELRQAEAEIERLISELEAEHPEASVFHRPAKP
jgi:hypothetical protein